MKGLPSIRQESVRAFQKGIFHVFIMLVAVRAVDFLLSVILARVLGPEQFGHLGVINSVLAIGLVLAGFGIPTAITKYVSETKDPQRQKGIFRKSATLSFGFSMALAIVLCLVVYFSGWVSDDVAKSYLFWLLPLAPIFVFNENVIHFIYGLGKIKEKAYVELGVKALFAVLILVFLMHWKLKGVVLAKVLHPLICAACFLPFFLRNTKGSGQSVPSKTLVKFGGFTAFANLATTIVMNVDVLIISFYLQDAKVVGIYRIAALLSRSLDIIPEAIIHALYPDLSRRTSDRAALRKMFWALVWRTAVIMTLVCVAAFILAPWLLPLLFGEKFAGGVILFQMLLPAPFLFAFLRIFGNLFSATGRPDISLGIVTVAGVINIGINFALVPVYGAKGAALAIVMTYGLNFVVSAFVMAYYLWGKTSGEE